VENNINIYIKTGISLRAGARSQKSEARSSPPQRAQRTRKLGCRKLEYGVRNKEATTI
jgi:hypothetical protein